MLGNIRWSVIWCGFVSLALVACNSGSPQQQPPSSPVVTMSITEPIAFRSPASGPSHIFLIVMENKEDSDVLGSPDAPYINQLAGRAAVADQYYAIGHPSLPNYLALIGGDTFGVDSDCTDCFQDAPNLADSIEAKGLTWKSYQEDLSTPCFLGSSAKNYTIHHDPFLYFQDIRTNSARCQQSVPLTQLDNDLQNGTVPNFAWITPNLIHDMHDGSVADGDRWLASSVPRILDSDAWKQNGALIITWDEGSTNQSCCGIAAGGRVPLLVLTPNGPTGYHSTTPASHYSLLRTIEELWGLEQLGHSGDSNVSSLADLFVSRPS